MSHRPFVAELARTTIRIGAITLRYRPEKHTFSCSCMCVCACYGMQANEMINSVANRSVIWNGNGDVCIVCVAYSKCISPRKENTQETHERKPSRWGRCQNYLVTLLCFNSFNHSYYTRIQQKKFKSNANEYIGQVPKNIYSFDRASNTDRFVHARWPKICETKTIVAIAFSASHSSTEQKKYKRRLPYTTTKNHTVVYTFSSIPTKKMCETHKNGELFVK